MTIELSIVEVDYLIRGKYNAKMAKTKCIL